MAASGGLTLRNKHVQVLGDMLKFKFKGKSGQHHEITLEDKRPHYQKLPQFAF
jgi:DNA topoisomerase IB